jgi:hypothetical protein
VVYKALEKSTGELVAVKHVSQHNHCHFRLMSNDLSRSILRAAMMIFEKSSKKSHFSALAPVLSLLSTRPASSKV